MSVFFPAGIYRFDQTLDIHAGIAGLQFHGVPGATIFLQGQSEKPIVRIRGNGCYFFGISFDGGESQAACRKQIRHGSNVLVNGSDNYFEYCQSINAIMNGIHLDGQRSECRNNIISRCSFRDNSKIGVACAAARDTRIDSNLFSDNKSEAITLDLGVDTAIITSNIIKLSNNCGGIGAIGYDRVSNVIISQNYMINSGTRKALLRAGNATGDSVGIIVSNNIISGDVYVIDLSGTVRTTGVTKSVIISSNIFMDDNSNPDVILRSGDQTILKSSNIED